MRRIAIGGAAIAVALAVAGQAGSSATAQTTQSYDTTTLAGKVASVRGTAGLQLRMSAFLEEEAEPTSPADVLGPDGVTLIEPGGGSVQPPDVTVNRDTAAAPQNETAIAVDPNRPGRVVSAANDYVTRTWSCTVGGTPCSALGDAYSGTYYSNDGGQTWCCASRDPQHLGTLIPGVTRLAGGQYNAGGDPSVAFDSRGAVYYAGLGFNRLSAPYTVAVNRGTFDGTGALSWSQPAFINPTTSPSILNDKEWIAADWHATSPFRDRVYVTWTRFLFNASNGSYVQSPILEAHSSDGGRTFSTPKAISGNVLYDQGSRVFTGPDGTVYAIWEGATRLSTLDGTWMAKSTDGGDTWSKPTLISTLVDIDALHDTAFRVNSFPAGAIAPDGTGTRARSGRRAQPGGVCRERACPAGGHAGRVDLAERGRLPDRPGLHRCLRRRRGLAVAELRRLRPEGQHQLPETGAGRPQHQAGLRGHRPRYPHHPDGHDPADQHAVHVPRRLHRGLHRHGGGLRQRGASTVDGHQQRADGVLVLRHQLRRHPGQPAGRRDGSGHLLKDSLRARCVRRTGPESWTVTRWVPGPRTRSAAGGDRRPCRSCRYSRRSSSRVSRRSRCRSSRR